MDEGAARVNHRSGSNGEGRGGEHGHHQPLDRSIDRSSDRPADADRLVEDIEAIRDNLGGLIGELDHRRHVLRNLRSRVRHQPVPVIIGAAVVVGFVAGAIVLAVRRRRGRNTLRARAMRFRQAINRMVDRPERVAASPPHVGKKILAAGGSAIAGVVGRRLAEHLVRGR
jgi:hypothetical protein